jgi:hypothetical protein
MRVERSYSKVITPTNKFAENYFDFHNIPAKLSRIAKQHPWNSAHLMRRFERGSSVCNYHFFIPTCSYKLRLGIDDIIRTTFVEEYRT